MTDLVEPSEAEIDAAARYLRETLQAGKRLTPWETTPKATKKKWLALAQGALASAQIGRLEAIRRSAETGLGA